MIELGSSDAPVIMGCSPYKTPWRLWAEKVGLIEEDKTETEVMSWGTRLQGDVLAAFAEAEKLVIYREQETIFHAEMPWLRATADGLLLEYEEIHDKERIIAAETKCVASQPPAVPRVDWLVQTLHQRRALESREPISRQYLICFGSLRMVYWEIPRHQAAMDRVLREEERFLEMVETQTPPPVRAEDASVLHRAWPWSRPETVLLSEPAMVQADAVYAKACEAVREGERCKDEVQAVIQAQMGERDTAVLANGTRYTWKTAKNGQRRFIRHPNKEEQA